MYITDENADKVLTALNKEMSALLGKELNKETLCLLGEIVDIMKDIREMDKPMEETGYSYDSYGHGGSYDGMMDYGYSNRGRRSYDGGSSYRRGYSRGNERDHIMEKMDRFMAQASNESERQLVRRIMNEL